MELRIGKQVVRFHTVARELQRLACSRAGTHAARQARRRGVPWGAARAPEMCDARAYTHTHTQRHRFARLRHQSTTCVLDYVGPLGELLVAQGAVLIQRSVARLLGDSLCVGIGSSAKLALLEAELGLVTDAHRPRHPRPMFFYGVLKVRGCVHEKRFF
jgi:hypothetical protein